ncbi:hypothetical protein [Clostridium sp. D53t1_180928_C8]|uniref:hypothetical protein n=1 Tax=Clostridium sp. D53t1_180928_C8 TaxID=2787101 RepID=UPI0018A8E717|nr:hypothetical protein [Clostridium sp. D53t1_180928_C8]
MREKTFKLVHILYVLLITNLISIFYLFLGVFSLTLVPIIFSNVEISVMLINDEIDGYSGILKIFNSQMKKYFKEYKRPSLLTGFYTLTIVGAIIMLRRVDMPMASALNYLFAYLYIVIAIYWGYYSLYVVIKEKSIKYIDALAIMFMNPKKLLSTMGLFILLILMALFRKEFLGVLAIAVISAIFVKINISTVESVKIVR